MSHTAGCGVFRVDSRPLPVLIDSLGTFLAALSAYGQLHNDVVGSVNATLRRLKRLKISSVKLVVVAAPWTEQLREVEELDVSTNRLQSLPTGFAYMMPRLKSLRLKNNHFLDARKVAIELSQLAHLEQVSRQDMVVGQQANLTTDLTHVYACWLAHAHAHAFTSSGRLTCRAVQSLGSALAWGRKSA